MPFNYVNSLNPVNPGGTANARVTKAYVALDGYMYLLAKNFADSSQTLYRVFKGLFGANTSVSESIKLTDLH